MWSFSRKQTISRKARGTFQKHLCHTLEDVTNCLFALPFLPPGCLRQRDLAGKSTSFDHACTSAPLRLLIYWHYLLTLCVCALCMHACVCVCVYACVCTCVYSCVRVFLRTCMYMYNTLSCCCMFLSVITTLL